MNTGRTMNIGVSFYFYKCQQAAILHLPVSTTERMLFDPIAEPVISAAINLVIAIVKFATPSLHFHLCLQKPLY